MSILKRLALKNIKANKKRTIATVLGISIATSLMVGIGLLFSTMRDYTLREIVESGGSHHVAITGLNEEQLKYIKNLETIKEITLKSNEYSLKVNEDNYYMVNGYDSNELERILVEGRIPTNNKEVLINVSTDNFSLDSIINSDKTIYSDGICYMETEERDQYEYEEVDIKVVGTYEGNNNYGCKTFYTLVENPEYITYIEFLEVKDVRDQVDDIASEIELDDENLIKYNEIYLSFLGESKYENFDKVTIAIMSIMLTILAVACAIIIYNSFAISIIERKKHFGLLTSVGGSKKQIRRTVYFENFLIGTIGIIIGIIMALIGISLLIMIINNIIEGMIPMPFSLSIYPIFILIPIVFMFIVIYTASIIPAFLASKMSPIENIKMKGDIKVKNKKFKTNKLVNKLFGFEAALALKNMKRNKRKYRISMISLFISTTLYLAFSAFSNYTIERVLYQDMYPYQFEISNFSDGEGRKIIDFLDKDVDTVRTNAIYLTTSFESDFIDSEEWEIYKEYEKEMFLYLEEKDNSYVHIFSYDDKKYNEILEETGAEKDEIIYINNFDTNVYLKNEIKRISGLKVESGNFIKFKTRESNVEFSFAKIHFYNDYKGTNNHYSHQIIVSREVYDMISSKLANEEDIYKNNILEIKGSEIEELDKLEAFIDDMNNDVNTESEIYYTNHFKEMDMITRTMTIAKILVYGFISLVTLIAVTGIFNTINTSITLRKKEFAMLRSVGLSKRGFSKMMLFESFFLALKSFAFSIPTVIILTNIIHDQYIDLIIMTKVMYPFKEIIFAIIGLFMIILLITFYSGKKIKNSSIIEALKDENI